jgi:signal transduction histidine kinase/CheY-like chemotaxis protein
MEPEERNLLEWLRSIFAIPSNQTTPLVAPPSLFISGILMVVSFAAYLIGPVSYDEILRYSFLMVFALSVVLVALHYINKQLAGWAVGFVTSLMVFWLAWMWESSSLLNLLVVPVILAALAANIPAVLLTVLLQSIVFQSAWWNEMVSAPAPQFLVAMIWLVALLVIASYFVVADMLNRAASDASRLQVMLNDSRAQQQKLSQALDDLAHANRQLSLLYDKNISLRRIAEEATEAKSTYIAKVSHEIRTPLNMILGITESIIENREDYGDDLPLDLEDDIRIIRRNSEHLLSLVNDVLDLTRAESSQMNLRKEWVDLESEIEKSIDIVVPLAKKKNLDLTFQPFGELPQIFCDRTRIRQVILNLLSNAVRYTDQGGVSIMTLTDEHWLRVQIKDTGPGIVPADVERIFEPFYRGRNAANQEAVGTGLGLSVSRQIVELHGGQIELESRVGAGSVFSFRLPLMRETEFTASPARFISEQWAWVERKGTHSYNFLMPQKKRVVFCAPEASFNQTKDQLADQVEFLWVDSIDALAEEVNRLPAHLAIVNEADPAALMASILQASVKINDTPIIGSSFSFPQEKVVKSGALEYIQKPFSNQHLRNVVSRVDPYPGRILIVDDNTEVQRLIVRVLQQQNDTTEFLLAETAAHAWKLIRRKMPDLILLDLVLPDGDGWQFLRKLNTHPQWGGIPVILVSACDLDQAPPHAKILLFADRQGMTMDQFSNLVKANLHLT